MPFDMPTWAAWTVIAVAAVLILGLLVAHMVAADDAARGGDTVAWQRGSKNWATRKDLRRNLVDEKTFLRDGVGNRLFLGWFGKSAVVSDVFASLLVVASTRAGKTTKLVIQNLLAHRKGPAVVTSVKADVWHLTRWIRGLQGGRAIGFDPLGVYGIVSARYSPLLYIHKFSDAVTAATMILNGSKALSDTDLQNQGFWDSRGRQGLAPLLLVAVALKLSMCDVNGLLAVPDLVSSTLRGIGDKSALRAWQLHTQQHSETRQNIESTIGQVLEVWSRDVLRPAVDVADRLCLGADPATSSSPLDDAAALADQIQGADGRFAAAKSADDRSWAARQPEPALLPAPAPAGIVADPDRQVGDILDLDAFLTSDDTLYLLCTQQDAEAYAPVFDVLIQMILSRVENWCARNGGLPLNPALLLLLDETSNFTKLRNLDVIVTKAAGEGIKLVTVWQSMAQIFNIYGPYKGRVVWDNHLDKIFLGGISDQETLRYICDMVGRDTYQTVSTNTSRDSVSQGRSWADRDVVDTYFFNSVLTGDEGVLQVRWPDGKMKPAIVNVPAWYADKRIRALIPPDVAARYDAIYAPPATARRWRKDRR